MATDVRKGTSVVRPDMQDALSSRISEESMLPSAKARSSIAALRTQLREPFAEYLGTCVVSSVEVLAQGVH